MIYLCLRWAHFCHSYFNMLIQAKACTEIDCHYVHLHANLHTGLSSYTQTKSWDPLGFWISTKKHLVHNFISYAIQTAISKPFACDAIWC